MREQNECGANASVSDQPLMDDILHRILSAAERLAHFRGKIEEHGNRLFGPQPLAECGDEPKKPEPQGAVDHLFNALAALDEQIARTGSAHARISRV